MRAISSSLSRGSSSSPTVVETSADGAAPQAAADGEAAADLFAEGDLPDLGLQVEAHALPSTRQNPHDNDDGVFKTCFVAIMNAPII